MKFEYRTKGETCEITAYLENEQVVTVPDVLEGMPVTEIGKYAFEGKNELLELVLPDTVISIGAHAFYNCRRLEKVSLSDQMVSLEDGAFKNCRSLRSFQIQVFENNMSCLKNLLSELNQEIVVRMEYRRKEKAPATSLLVFPKYSYEYSENTPARIINQLTFGSGVHYRQCMKEHDVDFRNYDAAFSIAKLNDTKETLWQIARSRLEYPYELNEEARKDYRTYLENNMQEIARLCVDSEDMEGLLFFGNEGFLTRENIEDVLLYAHEKEKLECVSVLLEYKNQHLKAQKKTFEL